ncbi:MAG: cell division protein FtsL [Candidatus Aminicenantes bacterium]|nr:cell division protein FtsL [Candidatus Aminicenantes bacterium]
MVRRKRDRAALFLTVLAVTLAAAALTFYLWHLNEMTGIGYSIARIEEEISRMKEEVRGLETRKAELLSLERVERIAREQLGLTDARPGQVRFRSPAAADSRILPTGASR